MPVQIAHERLTLYPDAPKKLKGSHSQRGTANAAHLDTRRDILFASANQLKRPYPSVVSILYIGDWPRQQSSLLQENFDTVAINKPSAERAQRQVDVRCQV